MKHGNLLLISILLISVFSFQQNSLGQGITWMKAIGGQEGEYFYESTMDKNNNIYITGEFHDTMDVNPNDNYDSLVPDYKYDAYTVKIDSSGELRHSHIIGGQGQETVSIISTDDSLNYYIAGTFTKDIDVAPGDDTLVFNTPTTGDIYFLKMNASDELVWAYHMITNSDEDVIEDIVVDSEGNIYCTGRFSGTMDFYPEDSVYELSSNGYGDIFIMKLSPMGDLLWAHNIGGIYDDTGKKLLISENGNLFISGSYKGDVDFNPGDEQEIMTSEGVKDVFLLNLTSEGTFQWAKSIGGIADDYIRKMVFDHNNNLLLGGGFRGETDLNPDPNEEYIADGGTWNDLFIVKLSRDGDFQWANTLGDEESVYLQSLNVDSANNVYYSVNFDEPLDIIPDQDSTEIVHPEGSDDFLIGKLNTDGQYLASIVTGSEYYEYARNTFLDDHANIYTIGLFRDNPEYSLNQTHAEISSKGKRDIFIQKLFQPNSDVSIAKHKPLSLKVFPNPSDGNLKIRSTGLKPDTYKIRLINSYGELLLTRLIKSNGKIDTKITIKHSGIYFLEISNESNIHYSHKIIVSQ
ncbi:MAG: T9SS type A sorting domain-containing protein [Bacteroidales bacterium]|nr:T9SS type A sorting domain-containing protein [Bacteroidales bacterium]MCF8333176.1 T9SS type A sorting domain-containing protein [Bacteroidales bacterium]